MSRKKKLTQNITLKEFENGYWYADEIKSFSKEIGIQHPAKLRKDELEELIKEFIKTGKVNQTNRKNVIQSGIRDIELGLSPSLPIKNYTSNKITKDFILNESKKINPNFKIKSGSRYRINRWRDEQIHKGKKITYGDLVKEFVRLNADDKPFAKAPVVRYINFLSEFLIKEKDKTRNDGIQAWHALKASDLPKTYVAWKKHLSSFDPIS
mgnify:CR=1 FL=1